MTISFVAAPAANHDAASFAAVAVMFVNVSSSGERLLLLAGKGCQADP